MVKRRQQNTAQKKASSGHVRIISGIWRGRKLPVHDAEGLRPTTDRVKETLFNWIATDIPNAHCLDLFAGSGGLGFEAASRQADKVTLIELNKDAYRQIKTNVESLKASNIDVVNSDALTFLEQQGTPNHIVFIDPPFRKGLLEKTVSLLESNNWLTEDAMIYIETEKELNLTGLPESWQLHREKVAGQVCYRLFTRTSE